MAPIALPRISTPQPNERFPIHWRRTVDCNYNHGGSGSFRPSDKGFGNPTSASDIIETTPVRHALQYAVDVPAICEQLLRTPCERATSLVNPPNGNQR